MASSEDGTNWGSPVAIGTYFDRSQLQTTIFTPGSARYVKITSLSEAGNRGSFMSIAEVNVYDASDLPPSPATAGSWGLTVDFPLVPVSAAIEWSSGRLLVWSSFSWNDFNGPKGHQTVTSSYDPTTQLDLIIPRGYQSQATLSDGRLFTIGASWSGGSSSDTPKNGEIYDSGSNTWSPLPDCPVTPMLTSDPEGTSLISRFEAAN
ncbi:MAG: hypothetical protein Q9179_005111 [Wetmoreana sp. 5 TL-2023]